MIICIQQQMVLCCDDINNTQYIKNIHKCRMTQIGCDRCDVCIEIVWILNICIRKSCPESTESNYNTFSLLFPFPGLLSWDLSDNHVDLEDELSTLTSQAIEGEEGKHGKYTFNLFPILF